MEPASPARRGPTIGCDAPSAVAVYCSSRRNYYVVRDAARAMGSRREGPAGGNLRSFRCFGGSCLPHRGHFGVLWQLSRSPKIVASIFGSSGCTSPIPVSGRPPHVAAPSSRLFSLQSTLTGHLFTLYNESATVANDVAMTPDLSGSSAPPKFAESAWANVSPLHGPTKGFGEVLTVQNARISGSAVHYG
jgi:hypothetical protein